MVVEFFEMVVGGCRWLYVVLSFSNYAHYCISSVKILRGSQTSNLNNYLCHQSIC